ncbi:hypothetical protein AB0O01_35545 [Streptomyces sp. NPDC093252]|uniref:hypothetical protein n=1 Tax=Streptomyces sp. NPDC093252 TaxID=3154980 RepID=UPI00343CEB4E
MNDLGGEYTAVIGNDNRIWWSFNGGLFQPVSQGHQANSAPAMISWQGRITLFHTGIDRQIYYSFLQDRSSNSWTPWKRVPGDAGLAGSPTVVTSGNTACISGVRVGGELTEQRMTAQCGGFTFGSGHRNDPSARARTGRDLNVWVNQSTDGGDTFQGWRRTTGGPAPSNATPSLSSAGSAITLSVAWDGDRDPRFPNNAIVGKQLYR